MLGYNLNGELGNGNTLSQPTLSTWSVCSPA